MEENPPPFWIQNHHYHHHNHRRRHRGSNIFLNTGALILILISTAIIFLYIAIPSMISIARQVFDPNLVKTSWTSLNIVLVLFAILCGFLGKKGDIEGQNTTPRSTTTPTKQDSINKNVDSDSQNDDKLRKLLTRNSNSYPDLRQDSHWIAKQNAWPRFYDDHYYYQLQRSDSKISGYYQQKVIPSPSGSPYPDRTQVYGYYSPFIKSQDVSTPSSPPPQPLQQPPPPPPQLAAVMPSKDESEAEIIEMLDMKQLYDSSDPSIVLSPTPVQTPPPPPLLPTPPPPPQQGGSRRTMKKMRKHRDGNNQGKHKEDSNNNEKSHKKRSGVSVTKDFITSFYHQRKRKKKQNRQSYDNFNEIHEPSNYVSVPIYRSKSTPEFPPPSPPPPPPPPPPPHSVIQNLFSSRKTKNKKHVPPPPPPPPPPYRTPSWKFLMQEVNTESYNNSPRSGYSASEEDDGSPSNIKTNSPTPTVFCPSPDVNTKADDFIARFRAKLTLEKLNSIKLKQGTGPSPLGMDFGQS